MKKLFALILALTLTFQLAVPAWAETVETVPETTQAVTESETVPPTEETRTATEPTKQPVETEETTVPTVGETTQPPEETGETTEPTGELALFTAEADPDVLASGACGDNLTWVLDNGGNLVISGTGDMEDYGGNYHQAPWYSWKEQIKTVMLPDGLTSIGKLAIASCGSLIGVTIPEGVTSIGYQAFYDCSSLTNVSIPEGVTSIGNSAFCGCSSLPSINIPQSVASIGESAFYRCDSLTDIAFAHRASDTLSIGKSAFDFNRYSADEFPVLTIVRVPSVKAVHPSIREYDWTGWHEDGGRKIVFEGSAQFPMTAIDIATQDGASEYEQGVAVQFTVTPEPLDSTDDYEFSLNAEKTTANAVISQKGVLTTLSTGTVTVRVACVQKLEIYDEITVTTLSPTGTLSGLTVVTLNDYPGEAELGTPVQMVPVFTPENAAERTVTWSVENGTGSATIDKDGLLTPLMVGSVTVYAATPSGIEGSCTVNIRRYAEEVTILLNGKSDITHLGIGEEVQLSAVLGPEDTTTATVSWLAVSQTGRAELISKDYYNRLVGKQEGTVLLRATAKDSKQVVAEKLLTITDTIRSYALPDGSGNLYYNTETGWITGADSTVKDVVIPGQIDGVTIVGIAPYAFSVRDSRGYTEENKALASLSIPSTVEEIGERAFCVCVSLSTLRFAPGSKLRKIGEFAFGNCTKLTSLTIPDSVEQLGKGALFNLASLKNLTVSGELDISGAFDEYYSCIDKLDTLTYTGTYILERAYSRDGEEINWKWFPERNAKKVILSESVTSIGDYAFRACSEIEEVEIRGNLLSIGVGAFQNCYALATINPAGYRSDHWQKNV